MKFYLTLLFYLIATNLSFGCDCYRKSIAERYFSSELVYIALIKENHQKEKEQYFQKLTFEVLEIYKGRPSDTLITGGLCRNKFHRGDTVIIFGTNDYANNRIITSKCAGNILIGSGDKLNKSRNERCKNLIKLEIESLQFYKNLNTKSNYHPKLLAETKSTDDFPRRFRFGNELVNCPKSQVRICHVTITFNNSGEVANIKILNKTPKKIKKQIKNYILKSKWLWNKEVTNKNLSIVESFLYPKESITFWDF